MDAQTPPIDLVEAFPDVADYLWLRSAAGMKARTREAAERGLRNTLYGVSLRSAGELVGVGRVIGDDGCVFLVVDIAVVPALQGRGLGGRTATPSTSTPSSASRRPRQGR